MIAKDPDVLDAVRAAAGDTPLTLRRSRSAEHAVDLAAEAARDGCDTLIAAGGDGLVHRVVQGIATVDEPPALGILPFGTANDLARHLELPLDDPPAALAIALGRWGRTVHADLPRVRTDDGTIWLVNQLTAGVGALATRETPPALKQALGGLAYLAYGPSHLGDLAPFAVEADLDGTPWSGPALAVSVANGGSGGGGLVLHERASLCDGRLQVLIVPDGDGAEHLAAVALDLADHGSRRVVRAAVRRLDLTLDASAALNLDGEPYPPGRLEIDIRAGWLPLRVPAAAEV